MENKRYVMIPGPTPVVRSIQEQMGREIQAFGDPRFVADYKEVIRDLGKVVNCQGQTFCVAGTGTLAMEMAVANMSKPGDKVLIISHGFFGDRFIDICQRKDRQAEVLSSPWGQTVPMEEIEEKLSSDTYAFITVSHVDTATGVRAPIEEIGELMKKFPDTLYIVDGVAATAGEYTDMVDMNIDVLFTASQKAFGVCPGLLMLWANEKALARRESLGTISEYYVDFEKWIPIMQEPAKYFATPAVNLVWAMKEAVRIVLEEGRRPRYERHLKNAQAVQKAMEAIGFSILAEPENRSVTLSNFIYPEGVDDVAFRNTLMEEGIIVAGGLGAYAGKLFRLGHMGNIDSNDMVAVLGVIERTLYRVAGIDSLGVGVTTYQREMTK